ncbi:ACYPI003934-like protein [Saitoella complicata NRRL Y-17804]|uniref:Phosphatidylinositol transfer protein N-terminal domain-containing protein n=1 Tax=Saitoella complicata (strain BCRC 22490 / CBS 7301 / JCM 7358 / NBRC 10748 / NRRL Y-17804) TaxID=698492 RepID=A0A0E9NKE1_SAICN|nr:ACYPI003934-like protein [Saitoella complicata NRRL Y-17804]ODQ50282.1 ACYPI003934-like protein [Saitoella complicata NRRL Y-17804]GAO50161.1 hypothetical protein G7K_4295-t1 [Saitoella complicata NRRL Y-17804]
MLIKEFRVPMPVSLDEYQVAQLYAVAEASKSETGGGEGIEVLANEPYENDSGKGQYTKKVIHLKSKIPSWFRAFLPAGATEVYEEAWNAYPYCRTVLTNGYMKKNFTLECITIHAPNDTGTQENIHNLSAKDLKIREVIPVDILTDTVPAKDYKPEEDPALFHSTKTGRGPLKEGWQQTADPVMCAYKLFKIEFKWMGLQTKVESFIGGTLKGLQIKFHKQLFCWIDKWYGMTMEEIRKMEALTKADLDAKRAAAAAPEVTEA